MQSKPRWLDPLIAGAIFALCLFLYNATLTPSLSYASPDGNELTTVAYTLGLAHPTGYPLFTWLGFLFAHIPIGDVAHRTNLMCATLGAAGVAMLYHILRGVEAARPAAAAAALLFGVSATFWSQAVITEVYAPNVFMLALTVWLLLMWAHRIEASPTSNLQLPTSNLQSPTSHLWFIAFALVFGLSLGMHMSNLGFAPAFALFILLTDWRVLKRPLTLLAAFAAFLLGVAQFLWLPLKVATITDPLILRYPPNTLVGLYVYTFGAFSGLRFAFPLIALPDRVAVYAAYWAQNFTIVGVALGILGAWVLLFRHPKRFWLFITMYFINVWFFVQYKVYDLDVFFIPAHFVFAIFVGFGVQQVCDAIRAALTRLTKSPRAVTLGATLTFAVLFVLPGCTLAIVNFRANDRTNETAIPDFYQNVFAMLPRDSVLVTRRGVFGYDAFYWRHVYNIRPDVIIPLAPDPRKPAPDQPIFSTVRLEDGEARGIGALWAPPREMLPQDAWYVPVLLGNQRDLTLYRASPTPPRLLVFEAQPSVRVKHDFGGLVLVGCDLATVPDAPRPRVHLKTYWRITQPRAYLISTRVDDITLETHDLGFGNLRRYVQQTSAPRGGVIVEEFDLVIPSYLKRGVHTFKIGLTEFTETGVSVEWVEAGQVTR